MIGKIVSHYKILEKLGGGGMGIIYKAQDLKLDRFVALKFLPPVFSMNEESKLSIIKEAKIAATLEHPNICNIHEVGETEDERIFIAMAYYEGETLKKKIDNNSLNKDDLESVILQIAKGLEQAHDKGIVHRDIKPENILITKQNEVKILDFGVAKIDGDFSVMDAEKVKGTIAYMSPEQISGQEIDQRSDIWAFGVLLYELITGKKPFSSQYEQSALYSIMHDDPDFSSFAEYSQIEYLKDVIQKCLEKNKADRFQSFSDIFSFIIDTHPNIQIEKPLFTKLLSKQSFNLYWYLITFFVVIIIAIFIWRLINNSDINLKSLDYVLVSNFENHTNESIFDYSLSEAMAVTLRQSPQINVLPKYRIANAMSLMKVSPDKKINERLSIEIGKREGIPFIVAGEISRVKNNYVLTASIIDVKSSEKIRLHVEEVEKIENILNSMDSLAAKIRKDLGESAQSISQTDVPLAKVTTPSIEALDLYSRGDLLEVQGKYAEAIEFKEKALAIDTLFVKAISDLSYNYYKVGNLSKAIHYHDKVLPLVNRVSEREKLSMLTVYYGPTFEMDFVKAYQYARKWTLLYPKDAIGYAHMGHLAMFAGNFQTAIEANKKAKEIDPSIAGTLYNNSGFAYALVGRADEALELFKKSQNLRPEYSIIDVYLARTFWMMNQLDSTFQRFEAALQKTYGIDRAKVSAHLISYYHFVGQLDSALTECDLAIGICREENRPDEESYFHYVKGEIEFEKGNLNNYLIEMKESERLSKPPFIELALVGLSYAKYGYKQKALTILSKLKKKKSKDPHFVKRQGSFESYINGLLAFNDKNYEDGIQSFKKVKKLYCGDPIYLLAQKEIAYTTSIINDTLSPHLYEELLNKRGEIFMSYLPTVRKCGIWIGKLWAESHYEMGLVFTNRKDTTNAIKYLNMTKNYWQHASPNHKKLAVVSKILRRLNLN